MTDWQPIETAPKKKWILVQWSGTEHPMPSFRHGKDDWETLCYAHGDATHWMPLPPPPPKEDTR